MKTWLAAGAVLAASVALIATAALGAFTGGERSAAANADGIKVHGDWKVEIKNPDGRLVRVHRFKNAFDGASNIAPILAHQSATGRYWLTLSDTGGANACGSAAAASCFVFEDDDPNSGVADWFGGLTASVSSGQLVIRGEISATRSGQFNHVRMLLSRCGNTTTPATCHPGAYGTFSSRTLADPIALVTGQQAIVTVTYTFSAA